MALTSYAISGAEDITIADNYPFYNKSGVDSDSRVYTVYSRDTGVDNKGHLAYSDDSGQTWTEELFGDSNYDRVAMFVDSSDNVHCVSCDPTSGSNSLKYRKRNSGGSWDSTETASSLGTIHHCNVAVDSSNTVWVVASYHDGSKHEIKVYKKPSGGSWSLSSTLAVASNHLKEINMKISNDILHCAIAQREVADSSKVLIRYDSFSTSTETWSGLVTICNGVSEAVKMPPDGLVVESDGTVWVFWANDGYGVNSGVKQIVYNKKSGGSWGSAAALTDSPNRYAYQTAICTDNDNIVLFYGHIDGGGDWGVFYQTWNGTSWGSEVTVIDSGSHEFPISLTNDGNLAIYYITAVIQGDSTYDLYAATDNGGVSASVTAIITETPNIAIAPLEIADVVAYKTPDESDLPTDKNIDRFVLLRPGDTGEGDAIRIDTWGNIGITCVMADIDSEIEIYVSNDGTDYILRDTFTESDELNINAAYKYVKAKQISGSALVILSGQKTSMLY